VATTDIAVSAALFHDDFNRPDSASLGNGWVEVEMNGQARIDQQALCFDADDENERPMTSRQFGRVSSGTLTWTFDLNFERTGAESNYGFWMQLGDGSQMTQDLPLQQGVAVNLVWGGPSSGLETHEGLGVSVDGSVTQLQRVTGAESIQVIADLDMFTYSVVIGSSQFDGIAFDEYVSIDTVRLFADTLNMSNFAHRSLDNLVVQGTPTLVFEDGFDSGDLSNWDYTVE
jgi:hypothetical protein